MTTITETPNITETHTLELVLNPAQEFIQCVQHGVGSFQRAGNILVVGLATDPRLKEKILELCPELSMELLNQFERIGLKQLCPQLLVSEAPGIRALRKMPISDQERHSKEPLQLLVVDDLDRTSHINVMAYNLTTEQVKQVFAKDHIRDQPGQRAWLENQRNKMATLPKSIDTDYVIRRQQVIINRPCILTHDDLIRLLSETSH